MVQEAQRAQALPSDCPQGLLFVPPTAHSSVMQWGHDSRVACHPEIHWTLAFIRQRFWWPTMTADTREYVAACSLCVHGKTSCGLLCPLPIPHRPWSHMAVDFVTGLPLSEGNTVIPTIVDRFSKMVHFVPLPKLPTAFEPANHLIVHVFRLHGIPTDIVSDRGLQFTSQVWRAFCKALGTTASLSYHPQSNGQTEWVNQDLESALCCVTSHHPASWSSNLPTTTPWSPLPQVCHHLWPVMVSSLPCSPPRSQL